MTLSGCGPGPTPATVSAAWRLAELLAEQGDLDEAISAAAGPGRRRRRARRLAAGRAAGSNGATSTRGCGPGPTPATGTPPGGWPSLLVERGDIDGLRARADAGDESAAWRLVELMVERGDADGLRAWADAGDRVRRPAAGRAAGRAR